MAQTREDRTKKAFELARASYRDIGVDVDKCLKVLATVPVSIQCWQGDDVAGFERDASAVSSGGIQSTGNYPGRARNARELRADLEKALSLIPGKHRVNIHAMYGETNGKPVGRDRLSPEHFQGWIDWAKARGLGLDFNPTFFAHPMAEKGFTLSSKDADVRRFWIRHALACRTIGAHIGRELGSPCVVNYWIPDGSKDSPVDRAGPRKRLEESLDGIFREPADPRFIKESLESKLFGIGSEAYVVGSHEFYFGYAARKGKLLCLDTGHFHPTEEVADKISSTLLFVDELMLHLSRPVRWDSDHIVVFDDGLRAVFQEVVRGGFLGRVHIGMDYFDGSVNRVAAWVVGARSVQKALLYALLEPKDCLRKLENAGDLTGRLAMLEELKTMPFEAVWDEYCRRKKVPAGIGWLGDVRKYENDVLSRRETAAR
jgi:L-rhamnose isomerase